MAEQIYSLAYFTGINTVDDSVRMAPVPVEAGGIKSAYSLTSAVNVDIDNSYALKSRAGCTKKISGTNIHSLWSRKEYGFYLDGSSLYLLNPDYTTSLLLSSLSLDRMSYVAVNDRVYMTNGTYIGYYDGTMHSLSVPTQTYKRPLPAGQLIAYIKGTLMVASGKVVYLSDALCDHYDERSGFRVFENNVLMLRPVDDGVYVSDGSTWYLVERSDDPAEYKKEYINSIGVVPFSDVVVDGAYVGKGVEGKVALWATDEGICMGDNKGGVKLLTPNYLMKQLGRGAAMIRNLNGQVHYIATMR